MSLKKNGRLSRREALRALSVCAAGGAATLSPLLSGCRSTGGGGGGDDDDDNDTVQQSGDPRFLIVLAATGGASIIDSALAIRESESSNPQGLNTFPDSQVVDISGTNLRAVNYDGSILGSPIQTSQSTFINNHKDDIMVATYTGTSVNHTVAQRRSITGNGGWNGRTIQEVVAQVYGAGYALPNVNMSFGGFAEDGVDASLPTYARKETVANPALWPLGLDGYKGIKDLPAREVIELARSARNTQLDPQSIFYRTFGNTEALQRWMETRNTTQPKLEGLDLITNLNIFPDQPPNIPLSEYGLEQSPDGQRLLQMFPQFLVDPLEAQCALAYLLIKYGVSVTVTISPTFDLVLGQGLANFNPPLSFDFSHQDHRGAQAIMWYRMLTMADRLITLLKEEQWQDTGTSYWDRSMIYFATDFGRSKNRQGGAAQFGTGHNLNNGLMVLSPMVNGGNVLGGVNPNDCYTYGFDPVTGAPDTGREMREDELFGGLLQALGIDTSPAALADMPAMRK